MSDAPEAVPELPPYDGIRLADVRLVKSAADAQAAQAALLAADAIGFDTESKPTFVKGESSDGPHLIQFADDRHAWLFQVGDTATIDALPPGRYSRQQAYVWLRDRVSFGEGPAAGTSLLRLVLEASAPDTPLTRRVHPDVWWTDVRDEVDAASAQTCIDRCLTSVIRVISLYPDFDALDTALQLTTKGNYEATLTQLEGVVGRWQAYHFGGGEGRAQLPWELVVNSWIYSQNRDDRIWHEPPHGALILAHPSPGLALTDTHGKAVILNVVELLGYSRWDYDPKTYSRKNEWGLSAIASYRQRADARDWNFGALVRTPINIAGLPLNVAWSRSRLKAGGHDDLVAISVDISRYLPKINADCLSHLPSCVAGRN